MKLYIAGGVTGNLHPFSKHVMRIFQAGSYSRPYVIEEAMRLYIAGGNITYKWHGDMDGHIQDMRPYILESYFYLRTHREWILKLRPFFKDFMLDSGAFTYINGLTHRPDWDGYIEEYAAFINEHDIALFFELDIDHIVGIAEVERLRAKLESLTSKPCIPVWHRSRGLGYWKKMTQEYDYVAIGGIVSKEISKKDYPIFTPLLQIAKANQCKVHGLGFTSLSGMRRYRFHSVDSTSWVHGNMGGYLFLFENGDMKKVKCDDRKIHSRKAAVHNFTQWLKFARYAETHF